MNNLLPAIRVEFLKARRSRLPLITVLAFSLAPFAGGFFMVVLKDPELARSLGMISTKAQIVAGTADWPTYLGMLAQSIAIGGLILFSFVFSWVFGREYSDHTISGLLALPTPRSSIVLAKFTLVLLWSTLLVIIIYLLGLGIGAVVGLSPISSGTFHQATTRIIITAILTIVLTTPIAFFASAGQGYLPPMGAAVILLITAQMIAVTGWGEFFPWSIPALYAGVAGPAFSQLGLASYIIVILTSIFGIVSTFLWWEFADQTY
jgi:ABC-2 type transport system permease protein